jgi:ABC-type multidrug transport system ATPase subunit
LRSIFGVCLQQDILFDDLNPKEYLLYFGKIKGLSSEALLSVVKKLLIEVQLFESGFTASKHLSGGEKRKLCIAIALIGNTEQQIKTFFLLLR